MSQISETDADNVMYWEALSSAHLLVSNQCTAYRQLSVHGITNGVVADSSPAPGPVSTAAAAEASPPTSSSSPQPAPAGVPESLTSGPPLTPAAQNFLQLLWQHQMPLSSAKELNEKDLQSMADAVVTKPPAPYWAHALTTLGYRHYDDFNKVADHVTALPDIPVPLEDATNQSEVLEKSKEARALTSAKLAIPIAMGMYVHQTGDLGVAIKLSDYSRPSVAASVVGKNLASTFSNSALTGLAISSATGATFHDDIAALTQQSVKSPNEGEAQLFGQKFDFTSETIQSKANSALLAAPAPLAAPSPLTIGTLNAVYNAVSQKGLDGYLTSGIK